MEETKLDVTEMWTKGGGQLVPWTVSEESLIVRLTALAMLSESSVLG